MPPVEDLLPVSGASVTLVEYSLGILKATTSPTNTATPQTFNTNLRPPKLFEPTLSDQFLVPQIAESFYLYSYLQS